jgi:hypothetical protein
VGAAIVLHAISVVPVTVFGLWFTVRDGLKLGGLAKGEGLGKGEVG